MINKLVNEKNRKILISNLKIILLFLFATELFINFVLKWDTSGIESKIGIYTSPYIKDEEQFTNKGYTPFSTFYQNEKDSNFRVTYNAIGLRGELPALKKNKNEYRIAILGDSFVEGFGATNDSTIPILLSEKLKQIDTNISIINAGICGSQPTNEINLYNYSIKKYQPDVVILFTNLSDIMDYEYHKYNNFMPLHECFFAVSHIFRVFYSHLIGYDYRIENYNKYTNAKIHANSQAIVDSITKFETKLNATQQKLIVVYLPLKNEIIKDKKINFTNSLQQSIIKSNLTYIDLKNEYAQRFKQSPDSLNDYFWPTDLHNNPKGYNLIADLVAQNLISRNLLKLSQKSE